MIKSKQTRSHKYFLLSAILLLAFSFLAIVMVTKAGSLIVKWDSSLFFMINNPSKNKVGLGGVVMDQLMIILTEYGREAVWGAVLILLLIFGRAEGRRIAILIMIAFVILIPVGPFLKDVVNRSRPIPLSSHNLLVKTDGEPSFPSGHAMIVAAGALIMLLQYNTGRKKVVISIVLGIEAMLVIYSRIYVGGHYPLDVIGGSLLGMGVGMAVIAAAASPRITPLFTFLGLEERKVSTKRN